MLVCQGYGLTETAPMLTCNCASGLRLGTVGRPVCEVQIRIGEQDEIQVRGPNVMLGYWGRPEETAAMFTADGWLKTGDVGALDADGFVRVTDRIKELIVTSGGKNIAPAAIEMMVGKDHYIEQIAVVGEGQRFLGALVIPSFEALEAWAQEQRIRVADRAELLRHHSVVDFIRERDPAAVDRPGQLRTDQALPAARARLQPAPGRDHAHPQAQAQGDPGALQGRDRPPVPGGDKSSKGEG